jgi:hypothetical protein
MRQLTSLDAQFLALENARAQGHVSVLGVYDPNIASGRPLDAGPHLDPENSLDLCVAERVTMTAGVPAVWTGMLTALDTEPDRWELCALGCGRTTTTYPKKKAPSSQLLTILG